MPKVYFDDKTKPTFDLKQSNDLIAVRTRSKKSLARSTGPVATPLSAEVSDGTLVAAYPEAGVEVYRVPTGKGKKSVDERKVALRASPDVRFAGGVLVDSDTKEPVLYTENIFVKFTDQTDPDDCVAAIQAAGLTVKEKVTYATNAYFVAAPEGTGQKVFDIAERLLKLPNVEYCHPELIRPRAHKGIFSQQWHLTRTTIDGLTIDAHANVGAAHTITRGAGITIAIIDNGVDIDHPEFASAGKTVAPRDVTEQSGDPRPKDPFPQDPENHGTACAGVACGDGVLGASGVAPQAKLMPIRLASALGSQREAESFRWAADNGADVISCSWGPRDGHWWDPADLQHKHKEPLPPNTRLAIDYAVTNGRGGKGCIVLFAAGNGRESVENDGYASYKNVIAVAASNDRGTRSVYSDAGDAVWCAFPSSDFGHPEFNHPEPLTKGIWTTDRSGAKGYNPGNVAAGDAGGMFANDFGGTSSSCPGAAGVAALVLSVNPNLRWNEVKDILKRACDKIDPTNGNYDTSQHSPYYGYGRLNAHTAVSLAKPQPMSGTTVKRTFNLPIPDMTTKTFTLDVSDSTPVERLAVEVDLKHTYVGDLIITLAPPAGMGAQSIVLHNRVGGSTNDLKKTYDATTTPALTTFNSKNCRGQWALRIQDAAEEDSGRLVSFALHLTFVHPSNGNPTPSAPKGSPKRAKASKRRALQDA